MPKQLAHRLWVHEDVEDGMDVIHHPDCEYYDPGEDRRYVAQYMCPIGQEIMNAGLDLYFAHPCDTENAHLGYAEVLEPGLYEIELWSEQVRRDGPWGPAEWDGGLRVIDQPRDPYPLDIEELKPPHEHQAWVWFAGAPVPHYELKRTGQP